MEPDGSIYMKAEQERGNYNYCDLPFYRVYCIIIMWCESTMAVASTDIRGGKETLRDCLSFSLFFFLFVVLFLKSSYTSFLLFPLAAGLCFCTWVLLCVRISRSRPTQAGRTAGQRGVGLR